MSNPKPDDVARREGLTAALNAAVVIKAASLKGKARGRRIGGVRALAGLLGISASAVSNWGDDGIPLARVLQVEKKTGVPRHTLRPDLWAPPTESSLAEKAA